MKWINFASVLSTGLIAGLLFAYSCSVNPALKALSDKEYVRAMQAINSAIQNPVFFLIFVGPLLLLPLSTFLLYRRHDSSFWYMAIATCLYVVGVFGVTMLFNVPLNDRLAAIRMNALNDWDISTMRRLFEARWNLVHAIRTVAAIVAFGMTIFSLQKG